MDFNRYRRYIEHMKSELFSAEQQEGRYGRNLHIENIELTPNSEIPIDIQIRKAPIEIEDGDSIGGNGVEVNFKGRSVELMRAAEKLKELPEAERLGAVMKLIHEKLKYPYPETTENDSRDNPDLKKWLDERFGERPRIGDLELNEFLERGYGDCKIMATAYLLAAQSAELRGIYANSGTALKNIKRPDNGQPIFRSVEVDRDLNSAHAWVEIQLSDGRWIPVDPTANMIGEGEMLKVFQEAGYKIPVAYVDEVTPKGLYLDRGEALFDPGESEKMLRPRLKIAREFNKTRKPKMDRYAGDVDIVLSSSKDPKSMQLDFKE